MPRRRRYVLIALALQVAMVLLGQVSDTVLSLSGVFGMGIPLVVGWFYSVREVLSLRAASTGGLLIGSVGAAIGLALAIQFNAVTWSLLPLGTLASSFTGWLGAVVGWTLKGRKNQASAE